MELFSLVVTFLFVCNPPQIVFTTSYFLVYINWKDLCQTHHSSLSIFTLICLEVQYIHTLSEAPQRGCKTPEAPCQCEVCAERGGGVVRYFQPIIWEHMGLTTPFLWLSHGRLDWIQQGLVDRLWLAEFTGTVSPLWLNDRQL